MRVLCVYVAHKTLRQKRSDKGWVLMTTTKTRDAADDDDDGAETPAAQAEQV